MTQIPSNIAKLRERIARACARCDRAPESVTLLAVSKTKPAAAVREAFAAGQRAFGENYLQEALEKIEALAGLGIEWHFIGPIQSNKTQPIARHFDWVHSVERAKIATRLSEQRPDGMPPLNVCVQVNISGEASKSGCAPGELEALCALIDSLPRLRLRGLMCIPEPAADPASQRAPFRDLRQLLERLRPRFPGMDTLSMGMSGDLEAAVAEGATIVRVGTDIFGARG